MLILISNIVKSPTLLSRLNMQEKSNSYIRSLRKKGEKFLEEKKYDDAEECFLECLKGERPTAHIWKDLAVTQLRLGKLDEAKKSFTEANKLKEGIVSATMWNELGVEECNKKKYEEAEESFIKATQCKEGVTDSMWENIAKVQLKRKKFAEAERSFENLIKYKATVTAAMWNEFGVAQYEQGKYQEAEVSFKAAIGFKEGVDAHIWSNLGRAQGAQKKYKEAEVSFQTATEFKGCVAEVMKDDLQRDLQRVQQLIARSQKLSEDVSLKNAVNALLKHFHCCASNQRLSTTSLNNKAKDLIYEDGQLNINNLEIAVKKIIDDLKKDIGISREMNL